MPYRGWNLGEQHNYTTTRLATSLKKLIEWLHEYMSVDTVTLLLPVADQQNLIVHTTIGLEEEIVQQIRIPIGGGIAGRIAASSEPMIVNDLSAVEVQSNPAPKGSASTCRRPNTCQAGYERRLARRHASTSQVQRA